MLSPGQKSLVFVSTAFFFVRCFIAALPLFYVHPLPVTLHSSVHITASCLFENECQQKHVLGLNIQLFLTVIFVVVVVVAVTMDTHTLMVFKNVHFVV